MGLFEKTKQINMRKIWGTMNMNPTEKKMSGFTSEELLKKLSVTPPQPQVSSPGIDAPQNRTEAPTAAQAPTPAPTSTPAAAVPQRPAMTKPVPEVKAPLEKPKPADVLVCKQSSGPINEVKFSDVYVTPDKNVIFGAGAPTAD